MAWTPAGNIKGPTGATGPDAQLPDAITGTGRFDPSRSLYAPPGARLRTFRAAVGKAVAGTGLCEIAWAGPSTAQGFPNPIATQSPAAYLTALLKGRGLPAQSGWVWVNNADVTPERTDARWTKPVGSTWTLPYNIGYKTPLSRSNGASNTLLYTSTESGTAVEWFVIGASGAYTYSIDGASSGVGFGTIAAGGSATAPPVLRQVTGLTLGPHTLLITGTTGTQVYVSMGRTRPTSGILVTDAGYGGAGSTDWDTTTDANDYFTLQPAMRYGGAPHLVLFDTSVWINDIDLGGLTQAQSVAAITRIIGQMKAAGSDVLLLITSDPSTTTAYSTNGIKSDATYQAYRQAMYGIADATSTMLLDCPDRVGQWAAANTAGLMNDAYHFTPAGSAHLARAVESALV